MEIYDSITLLWFVVSLISSTPSRRNSDTVRKCLRKTGEYIAVDSLIQKYEQEHQQFFEQQSKDDNGLHWPELENKNLSKYCRKYLQYNMPRRKNEGVIGFKMEKILHYGKENKNLIAAVVILKCRVKHKSDKSIYYITRAPETNCVYALKSDKHSESHQGESIFTIINKCCEFEGQPLKKSYFKRKKARLHQKTGQPVANDEYLLKYELEHHEFIKKEANGGKQIKWLYAVYHPNLDSYCSQYTRTCAPGRKQENVIGTWNTWKLHYQKLETKKDIEVTIVTCLIPSVRKRYYYMTKAPESNCVYALVRKGCNAHFPFVIIFKHCDFEDPIDQKNISKGYDILDKNLIPKTELKEEIFNKSEILQIFPKD